MSTVGATAPGKPRKAGRLLRIAHLPSPRTRRRLAALAAAASVLLAGYLFWLRDSSLVQVETVTITGVSGADAGRVHSALSTSARGMTTLHVDRRELERAAAGFPVVRHIEVSPDFPHGVRIHVVQHRPAALLESGSRRVPVAADGTVLAGLVVKRGLPLVKTAGALPPRQVGPGPRLEEIRVAGGTPAALRARVHEVGHERGKGVVVPLENGPDLIFGDGTRASAKWAAAVRVLADRDAAGAAYVDVRIPERPAAGGLPVKTVAPVASAEAPSAPAAPSNAAPSPATEPVTPEAGGAPAVPSPPPPAGIPAQPQQTQADGPVTVGGGASPNTQP